MKNKNILSWHFSPLSTKKTTCELSSCVFSAGICNHCQGNKITYELSSCFGDDEQNEAIISEGPFSFQLSNLRVNFYFWLPCLKAYYLSG